MKISGKLRIYAVPVIVLLLFLVVLFLVLTGIDNTANASRSQQMDAVKRSVENGITLCYSIEGIYPDNLDYLTENYGVNYNKDKYIVHYDCFASNVRPNVAVIEKE